MPFGSFANENDHLLQWREPNGKLIYYRIKEREPFNWRTGDADTNPFSSVANGSESGFITLDDLEPDTEQLYQVWWGVKDGARYFGKIPSGDQRYGIHENVDVGFVDNLTSPYHRPSPNFEFWLKKGKKPAFNCDNDSGVSITPQIWFTGFKYVVEEISEKDVGDRPFRRIQFGLTTT